MSSAISWPKNFLPGTTDNFVSNETYQMDDNVGQITPPKESSILNKGDHFSFSTFGLTPLQAEVFESVTPTATTSGRLGWRAWQDGDEDTAFEIYHAWIIENVEWGAVRILTQESQIGKPAAQLATVKPNPMLNGHQNWVEGLAKISRN